MNLLLNILIRFRMFWIGVFYTKPFLHTAKKPRATQMDLLMKIVENHKNTGFGRQHRFSEINSYADFRGQVPVHDYEDLRNRISQQRLTGKRLLNNGEVIFYATTSGTTGDPKYIPILEETLEEHKSSQKVLSHTVFRLNSKSYDGKLLAIVSPAVEGYLEDDSPYGSVSGLVQQSMPSLTRMKYLLPYSVLELKDSEVKYLVIAAYALGEQNVSLFATANPSTVIRLLDVINENFSDLFKAVQTGDLSKLPGVSGLSLAMLKSVGKKFRCNPKRAQQLKDKYKCKGKLDYFDIWPYFQSVVCWTKGSCGILMPKTMRLFARSTQFVEMGYISSEFRGTVNIDGKMNKCLPTLNQIFFEFVEREAWENESKDFLLLDQLDLGKQYYVFVTTSNGLYRYFINDVVEVSGFCEGTALIDFVQKGKGVTNLTGEKLYEGQLLDAMNSSQAQLNFEVTNFLTLADQDNVMYQLYVEGQNLPQTSKISKSIERRLYEINMEYAAKRESARLGEMKVVALKKGAFEAYKEFSVKNGQREGQFKILTLQYQTDFDFSFSDWIHNED